MGKLEEGIRKLYGLNSRGSNTENAKKKEKKEKILKEEIEKAKEELEEAAKEAIEAARQSISEQDGLAAAVVTGDLSKVAQYGAAGAVAGRFSPNKIGKATIGADTQTKKLADRIETQEKEEKNKDNSEQTK